MTTTGTTLFNMDFTEIAEEAWERAGREMRSGYDLRTARRSMNLMTIEWQSKGINMWTMEQGVINLTPGLSTYALPVDTIDLLEHVIRTGSNTTSAFFTQTSGVTLNVQAGKRKLTGQYAGATLKKVAINTWDLSGNLTA